MVGNCDDGHAKPLTAQIKFNRVVVRLLAEVAENGRVAPARRGGMHMKVAAHDQRLDVGYEQSMKETRNISKNGLGTY